MKKVDLVDKQVRPCNFNDFYYYKNYFSDEKIEAIHEMVRRDSKKGKATLISLMGYKKTLKFAENLKKKIIYNIRKSGKKSKDLIQSVEFILERKF